MWLGFPEYYYKYQMVICSVGGQTKRAQEPDFWTHVTKLHKTLSCVSFCSASLNYYFSPFKVDNIGDSGQKAQRIVEDVILSGGSVVVVVVRQLAQIRQRRHSPIPKVPQHPTLPVPNTQRYVSFFIRVSPAITNR